MYKRCFNSILFLPLIPLCMFSCSTIPKGATVVKPFYKEKYLGKWYEIARMDFKFEKGLSNTTAEYSLKDDGKIKVVNRGFNTSKNKAAESVGKAKFRNGEKEGALKVSFFGPFYAAYNVIAIDEGYRWALVAGKNTRYLWLLSRDKKMPENIKASYLKKATETGYDTSKLVWVKQD